MKFLLLISLSILNSSSQNLVGDKRFLTAEDFKRASELSDEQIDRGVGIVDTKAEFNSDFYGGDIVNKPPSKRKDVHGYITRSSGRHWKDGRVPYEFVDDFTYEEKLHIAKAIQFFNEKTCIKIVPRNLSDRNYIQFVKRSSCSSEFLGRKKYGPQELSLGKNCIRLDIIVHELMHAIGFMHEFARPDRDQYIQVNFENIAGKARTQFRKLSGELFGDWNLPFDVKSVMFYEENAAARRPGLTVMRAQNGEKLRCQPHSCPTKLDIDKINKVYQCKNIGRESKSLSARYELPDKQEPVKESCTSLKWKSSDQVEKQIDNPVVFKEIEGKKLYVCRSRIWINEYVLGMSNQYGCRGTQASEFSWNFANFDILTNPDNVQIDWISADSPPKNSVSVGKRKERDLYVMKCVFNYDFRSCLNVKYLVC